MEGTLRERVGPDALRQIEGTPPSIFSRPSGCAFHPRCPFCAPACRTTPPPLTGIGQGRRIACTPDPLAERETA